MVEFRIKHNHEKKKNGGKYEHMILLIQTNQHKYGCNINW